MLKRIGTVCLGLMLSALLVGVGCHKSAGPKGEKDGADGTKPVYASKGDEGTIAGKVSLDGTPATPKKIDMSKDPNCASAGGDAVMDDIAVADGKLANVFVYVK